jgi:HSP20 family molecular chaperone IbpA
MTNLASFPKSDFLLSGLDFFDEFFGHGITSQHQGIQHHTEDDKLFLSFDLPGIPEDSVEATFHKGVLTVKGEHGKRSYFYRVVVRDADPDSVENSLENGVLTLTFNQADNAKERNLLSK